MELSKENFESRYNNGTSGLFKTGQNRGIGSDKMRDLVESLKDSVVFTEDLPGTVLGSISAGDVNLSVKVIEIGDWNMDSDASVTVAHGLTLSKIRTVSVMIVADSSATIYSLNHMPFAGTKPSGSWFTGATDITLQREIGGTFDGSAFDSTSFNRGWVTIWYESDFENIGGASLRDGGLWTFADNSNNFPTATHSSTLYITTDSHGSPGDADYVPAGSWMISKIDGANEFSEYSIK
jgi:hypothetical protein